VLTVQILFLALLLLRAVVKAAFLVLQMVLLVVLEAVVLMQVLLLERAVQELQGKVMRVEMELLLSVEVRAVAVRVQLHRQVRQEQAMRARVVLAQIMQPLEQ
jgi:hypothetical protein